MLLDILIMHGNAIFVITEATCLGHTKNYQSLLFVLQGWGWLGGGELQNGVLTMLNSEKYLVVLFVICINSFNTFVTT